MAGLTIGANGWLNNVIVYQIQQFNIKSIDAAQFANILTGCTNVSPIIAAIFADSFLGSFGVISISCLLSLLVCVKRLGLPNSYQGFKTLC